MTVPTHGFLTAYSKRAACRRAFGSVQVDLAVVAAQPGHGPAAQLQQQDQPGLSRMPCGKPRVWNTQSKNREWEPSKRRFPPTVLLCSPGLCMPAPQERLRRRGGYQPPAWPRCLSASVERSGLSSWGGVCTLAVFLQPPAGDFSPRKSPQNAPGAAAPGPLLGPAACIPRRGIARAVTLHRVVTFHTACPFPASRGPVESDGRYGYRGFH